MDANEVQSKIKDQIKDNSILIYMKGSPYEPQCGFSARTVQALIECEAEFSYVDVLSNPDVRQNLPIVSEWPTFPPANFANFVCIFLLRMA